MMAGNVSGSFSSQEWVPSRTTTRSPPARRAASRPAASGTTKSWSPWSTTTGTPLRRNESSISRLPGERSTDRNGIISCHGRVMSPQAVRAHRRASLAVCGASSSEMVVRLSTTAAVENRPSSGGHHLQAVTIWSQASPTMASMSTTATARCGSSAASSVTSRPPMEWPAYTARRIPSSDTTRPSRRL